MSTTTGKIYTEGIYEHSIEVYVGVEHVILFIQNGNDRDGTGTKILLDEDKWNELQNYLMVAGQLKGWTEK